MQLTNDALHDFIKIRALMLFPDNDDSRGIFEKAFWAKPRLSSAMGMLHEDIGNLTDPDFNDPTDKEVLISLIQEEAARLEARKEEYTSLPRVEDIDDKFYEKRDRDAEIAGLVFSTVYWMHYHGFEGPSKKKAVKLLCPLLPVGERTITGIISKYSRISHLCAAYYWGEGGSVGETFITKQYLEQDTGMVFLVGLARALWEFGIHFKVGMETLINPIDSWEPPASYCITHGSFLNPEAPHKDEFITKLISFDETPEPFVTIPNYFQKKIKKSLSKKNK